MYYQNSLNLDKFIVNGYKILKEIGRGTYGVVYKAQNSLKCKCAIKVIFATIDLQKITQELAFLKFLQGDYFPKLLDVFITNGQTCMVFEYFKFDPFHKILQKSNIQDIRQYMQELLRALKLLKNFGIVHRDVKHLNFLYNMKSKKGILIDFGVSELHSLDCQNQSNDYLFLKKISQNSKKNKFGTETYMPLESLLKLNNQSYAVDMWAAGILFFQLLTKKFGIFKKINIPQIKDKKFHYLINFINQLAIIYGKNEVTLILSQFGYQLELPNNLPENPIDFNNFLEDEYKNSSASQLLQQLLRLDPSLRITPENALKHDFFIQ